MLEHESKSSRSFNKNPLRKLVHFNHTVTIPVHSTTSTSLLTSGTSSTVSLSLPLLAEKPGVRFKIFILFLSLFIALIVGFILSLILVTQFIHIPKRATISSRELTTLTEQNFLRNHYLFEHINSSLIEQFDFESDICEDFYGFICRKWLINHPLNSFEFKRSWLTEKSKEIRNNFAQILANLSTNYAYHYRIELEQNQTETSTNETELDDYGELTSAKNELEQYYSFGYDEDADGQHRLIKRELNSIQSDYSRSILNMFVFYDQCLQTSNILLHDQLKQIAYDHFWFTNTNEKFHFDFLFEQMLEHSLMRIWNMNTIHLGTQIIIHIQRQIQNHEQFLSFYQIQQANLFENYLQTNQIDFCSSSTRAGNLTNTINEYNDLLNSFLLLSNSSTNDDLHQLIHNPYSLPIIYSSIKQSNELKDFLQFLLDREYISSINHTDIYHLISNFTYDLEHSLLNLPIFRSTISYQCQLYLHYYIHIRSLNISEYEQWFDYISTSIIQIIYHSWPGDASYICLYSTIVRENQFETIPYWNEFIRYTKKQIRDYSSSIIKIEIRLVDFFQFDSIFRFLFADRFAHYCNLMIYKYGQKLLSFMSIFQQDIQNQMKTIWKENIHTHSNSFLIHRIPNDCLTLLETYYPFTLSSFYENYMSNKTNELYSIAYELRDLLSNTYLLSLEFHIQSERLKLFHDLSLNTHSTSQTIPYEYYSIENHFLLTTWNIIDSLQEELLEPIHEVFEINGFHSVEQGIFLQPTVAELYSNESTRLIALLLIAHELGHAICPCGINLIEREYFADLIALRLIFNYNEKLFNRTLINEELKDFFIIYGQSECIHVNREMMNLLNKEENFIDIHLNRVVKGNEQFSMVFNCSLNQYEQSKKINSLLVDLCATCRKKKIPMNFEH